MFFAFTIFFIAIFLFNLKMYLDEDFDFTFGDFTMPETFTDLEGF